MLVTFKTEDSEGHYFKVVVLQGYTQFILMNIVYFSEQKYFWGPKTQHQLKKSIIS